MTYTWNVVQTTIQDTYQIQLQTTFATDVPAPVVTITAPASIPTLVPGQSGTFNVDDHQPRPDRGAGRDADLPTDPEYTFTALSDGHRRGAGRELGRGSHHGDARGSAVALDQRRRHDVHRERRGAQPRRPGYRLDGLCGLYQHGQRGHPGAALDADGDAREQPGGLPVSGFRPLAGLAYNSNATPVRLQQRRAVPGQRRHARHARARRNRADPRLLRRAGCRRSGARPLRSRSASPRWIRPTRDAVDWPTVLPGLQLGSINDAAWSVDRPDPGARIWARPGASTSRRSTTTPPISPASASRPPTSANCSRSRSKRPMPRYFAQTLASRHGRRPARSRHGPDLRAVVPAVDLRPLHRRASSATAGRPTGTSPRPP